MADVTGGFLGTSRMMKRIRNLSLLLVALHISALSPASMLTALGAEAAKEPGLLRVHFDTSNFTRPKDSTVEPQINFDTGTEHSDYSRILLGGIRIPTSKEIEFSADADDGLEL